MSVDRRYPESQLTDKIIGVAIGVHKKVGPGFVEKIYQRSLYLVFKKEGFLVEREKKLSISFEKASVGYEQVDFVINSRVLVEIKATGEIKDIHKAKMLSYLKASGCKVGLILNFGRPVLEIKRVIN